MAPRQRLLRTVLRQRFNINCIRLLLFYPLSFSVFLSILKEQFSIKMVWIPLVNATKENGCMWVLPKLHKGPVLPHESDSMGTVREIERTIRKGTLYCLIFIINLAHYLQIKEEYVNDKSRWVCCPVKKVIYLFFPTTSLIIFLTKILGRCFVSY
jgi:hypothetical protein